MGVVGIECMITIMAVNALLFSIIYFDSIVEVRKPVHYKDLSLSLALNIPHVFLSSF